MLLYDHIIIYFPVACLAGLAGCSCPAGDSPGVAHAVAYSPRPQRVELVADLRIVREHALAPDERAGHKGQRLSVVAPRQRDWVGERHHEAVGVSGGHRLFISSAASF